MCQVLSSVTLMRQLALHCLHQEPSVYVGIAATQKRTGRDDEYVRNSLVTH
jgi:hypothetical protein